MDPPHRLVIYNLSWYIVSPLFVVLSSVDVFLIFKLQGKQVDSFAIWQLVLFWIAFLFSTIESLILGEDNRSIIFSTGYSLTRFAMWTLLYMYLMKMQEITYTLRHSQDDKERQKVMIRRIRIIKWFILAVNVLFLIANVLLYIIIEQRDIYKNRLYKAVHVVSFLCKLILDGYMYPLFLYLIHLYL